MASSNELICSALASGSSSWVAWGNDGPKVVTIDGDFDGTTASFVAKDAGIESAGLTPSAITLFTCTEATSMKVELSASHQVRITLTGGTSPSIQATKRTIKQST